jgi:hypothetical protein
MRVIATRSCPVKPNSPRPSPREGAYAPTQGCGLSLFLKNFDKIERDA